MCIRDSVVVVLFGGLFYLVELSNAYEGVDAGWTYAYDALRGEDCPVLVQKFDNELLGVQDVLEGATLWDDVKKTADSFITFLTGELRVSFTGPL